MKWKKHHLSKRNYEATVQSFFQVVQKTLQKQLSKNEKKQ